jgi:putative tricarboxylic transport membrane protein
VRTSDVVAGALGLILALAVCAGALAMPMGTRANPGAGFTPFWVGVALGVLSLGLVVTALADHRTATVEPGGERTEPRRLLLSAGAVLLYALVLGVLGYLLATFLLLIALVRVLDERRWIVAVAFAALASAGSWALFKVWLGVGLPDGVLGALR